MKNLKIDYKKKWGDDGTTYNQTITTTNEIIEKYNKYIEEIKEKVCRKFIYSNEDLKIMAYLKPLQKGINFLHLTELDYFKTFYIEKIYIPPKRDLDFERILWRNTIILVK